MLSNHEYEIQDLKASYDVRNADLEMKLKNDHEENRSKLESKIEQLEILIKGMERESSQMSSGHENSLEILRQKHQGSLKEELEKLRNQSRNDHQNSLEKLRRTHQESLHEELQTLEEHHERSLKSVNRAHQESLQEELQTLREAHENSLEDARRTYQESLHEESEGLRKLRNDLREESSSVFDDQSALQQNIEEEKLEALRNHHRTEIETHLMSHDAKIKEFESLLHRTREQYEQETEELRSLHKASIEAVREQTDSIYFEESNEFRRRHDEMVRQNNKLRNERNNALSADVMHHVSKDASQWKSRALELEKALREARSLGERAFNEIKEIQNKQDDESQQDEERLRLQAEIEELKRQRAAQVYEMGQNRIRFAMDSRRRNDTLQMELAQLRDVRMDARNASLRRCLNSLRGVYLRRAWQQWRGVIRWCHYAWFQERNNQFRFTSALLIMDGIARASSMRVLASAFRFWKESGSDVDDVSTMVMMRTPIRSSPHESYNTPISQEGSEGSHEAIQKLNAISSALASQEKQRSRRKLYYRFLHASHLLKSAELRWRQRKMICAFQRWVHLEPTEVEPLSGISFE